MKLFNKTIGIIAGCLIGLGLICLVIGACFGGNLKSIKNVYDGEKWTHIPGLRLGWVHDADDSDHDIHDAEFIINDAEIDYKEEYTENIQELEWNIEYGRVTVRTGERFSVVGTNLYKKVFHSYVEDDVWHLECRYHDKKIFSPIEEGEVVITIPEDAVLKEASINLGAGEAELTDLCFEEAEIEIGAGHTQINNVTIRKEGKISVGMGELVLKDFKGQDTRIDCGMGNVNGSGKLSGDCDIECGVGEIHLKLAGAEGDYNYEVSSGIGSVEIGNDTSYSGVSDKKINHHAKDTISLDCGIGSITLEFEE